MKLIDEEKVKQFKNNYNSKCILSHNHLDDCFDIGVNFAESELQNLAIEFRKWPYYYNFDSPEENLKKFIEQRKQKK